MRKKLENNIQAEIIKHFNNTYCTKLNNPRYVIFSVPNELARNNSQMLATGIKAGVSDLIVVMENKVLFIELKTSTGRQRPQQAEFQQQVEALGHKYYICRSLEDFKDVIQDEKN